jgi:serine/threonine protein kinase
MSEVQQSLIDEALKAFNVIEVGPIGASGGQKAVRHVKRDNSDFVLKIISLTSSPPEMLRRAEREVDLLSSLDSPHVVSVASHLVELGNPTEGAAWLEEYLDGEDLTELLFESKWAWHEACRLGYEMASGLAVAHASGVVHRDLSSNNIRRTSNGVYKILDFGFAHHSLRSGITFAGQPGTPGFMSPEHLNSYSGRPMTASDIFGVGTLMYSALAAELPFPYNGDDIEYIQRLSTCRMKDIATIRPDLKPEQLAIVNRCLHRQPARRFHNGFRLAAALERLK